MRWTLDQLEVLVACAECGSFSAAARHLGRAQSAVSTAIAHLEVDLACTLFDRDGRLPRLTEAGEALLHEARAVLRQCQRLDSRARAIAEPGDCVLLSPACASLDQFANYLERGEVFRRWVRAHLEGTTP